MTECSRKHCRREPLPDRKQCERCTLQGRARNNLRSSKDCQRRSRLRIMYGISPEEYDTMRAAQGGVCRICSALPRPPYKHLQVDHCHRTGKVRGLLCHRCNKAIGLLGDTADGVARAARYLEEAG